MTLLTLVEEEEGGEEVWRVADSREEAVPAPAPGSGCRWVLLSRGTKESSGGGAELEQLALRRCCLRADAVRGRPPEQGEGICARADFMSRCTCGVEGEEEDSVMVFPATVWVVILEE